MFWGSGDAAAWIGLAQAVTVIIIVSALLQNLLHIVQLAAAAGAIRARPPVVDPALIRERYGRIAPSISVIAPAFNEEVTIIASAHSMLSLRYPHYDVIIVNDGSTDSTLERLRDEFKLVKVQQPLALLLPHRPARAIYRSLVAEHLWVIDKENGGKADAQNAAISLSHAALFCVVDGDTILEPDALMRAVVPFLDEPDRTIAVGGTLRIANGLDVRDGRVRELRVTDRFLPRVQILEYLRSFVMSRLAWSRINALMIISGAFGLFRRDVVMEIGGYTQGSLGEDLDIVIRLHAHMIESGREYRIGFVPEPMCWTEVPESLRVLARQRARWQNGALECFFSNLKMALNPRYGRIGMLGFGHILVMDIVSPLLEVIGYLTIPLFWYVGLLSYEYLIGYAAIVFGLGTFTSIASLILAEFQLRPYPHVSDLAKLGSAAVLENFGYRQLHNLWRVWGMWQYLTAQHAWGEMPRIGFAGGR
ncbi:MAG TPA: glycosyltransferase family 2 protein [Allosphingosinicella sp.]|jgi:cellulose synthase/poly-beta-1,6-N-acetylglucosamine synthase-like glycosyltransferase